MSKAVLITGGGTGIGAACARKLAAAGYQVALTGRRREPIEKMAAEIGGLAVVADAGIREDAQRAVAEAVRAFGGLHALVCSAGIGLGGTILDQPPEGWEEVMRVNVTGVYLSCRAALPELIKSGGSIVTVGSTNSLRASPASAAYCTSKAAVLMLTQCIAADHARDGIRANCVLPGWIRTPMADLDMESMAGALGSDREGVYQRIAELTPQRSIGLPQEVADVVAWLLGPESSYVNGAGIPVDGASLVLDPSTVSILP